MRKTCRSVLILCGCALQAACSGPANQSTSGDSSDVDGVDAGDAPIQFREVATKAGVEFTYYNGSEANHCTILESLGGGCGMIDYDLDGLVNICFSGGGKFEGERDIKGLPSAMFRNLGDWRFVDITKPAGIDKAPRYSHGVTVGDYDSDGFPDVFMTGYGGVQLWRNQGDGTFLEVHRQARLNDESWSTSAGWGDLNGDGHLDLYVAHYVDWSFEKKHPMCYGPTRDDREICGPKEFTGLDDMVFFSNGDGTFRDAREEAGLSKEGKGLGVVLCDVDNDADLDIYVGNDTTDNFLYLNDGQGRFEEVGVINGVGRDHEGIPNGSMGVDVCDYNRDGLPDLWAANYERESYALYKNEGDAIFMAVSPMTGITALGGLFVGFGTGFADFDFDGDEDVVVTNGHVIKYPRSSARRQVPLLLLNRAGPRFHRVRFPEKQYFSTPREGRGLALGDLDNDGDLDIAISHINEPIALLKNDSATDGDWVSVQLVGTASNRDAIGARLVLKTSTGDMVRFVKGGASYLSQNDHRIFWGLPRGSKIKGLTIFWPSGEKQTVSVTKNKNGVFVEPVREALESQRGT